MQIFLRVIGQNYNLRFPKVLCPITSVESGQ